MSLPSPSDVAAPAGSRWRRRGALVAALLVVASAATMAVLGGGHDAPETLSVRNEDSAVAAPPAGDAAAPAAPDPPAAPAPADAPAVTAPETTATTAAPSTSTTRPAGTTSTTAAPTPAVAPVPRPPSPGVPTTTGLYVVNADTGALRRVAAGAVHDPVWSPDGTRLLFHRDGLLLVVGADGSGEAVVASDVALRAAWSPDGTLVAFISGGNLFVARPDGTDRRQVADGGVMAVDWSPDGAHLALVGLIPMQNRIEVVRPDGSDRRLLATTVGTDGKVAWSPDSTRLGFLDYNVGPAVLDVASGTITPITTQRNMGWRMSWSPGGDEVAYADYLGSANNLAIGRADGGGVRTIAAGAVAPDWSRNGARIAFLGNRSPDGRGQLLTHLYVIGASGQGERIVVADTRSTHVDAPAWAPDSVHVAFAFVA